jgi:hypothetical protein
VLPQSAERIGELLADSDTVLDIGGWAAPFARADWVVDLLPYESRGLYAEVDPSAERFDASTWIVRDVCDREPLPFDDRSFDFVVCSHTLEDIRDPVWVCSEIERVGKAGYIEVPSRLEEQTFGVHGQWVGWSHHHWLIDIGEGGIEFVFKPHALHGTEAAHFAAGFADTLSPAERVQSLFWERSFNYAERVFTEPAELDAYLADFVAAHRPTRRRRSWGRLSR